MRTRHTSWLAVAVTWLLIGNSSMATPPKQGHIHGSVLDEVGATISGASVYVHNVKALGEDIKLATHTDVHGVFDLVLPEGGYDVLVVSPSFSASVKSVPVREGKTARIEYKLKVLDCSFPSMNCDTFQ